MLRSWGRLPAPIRYLAPRIVALPCLWLAVTLGVFLVLFVFTDPTDAYVGPHATPQARETARVRLGIDDSSFQLYVDWLSDMAHGDLGKSSLNGRTVGWSSTEERLKPTAELVVLSLLFGAVMGGAIAWLARQDRFLPRSAMMDLTSAIMASVPVFVIGVLVLVLPSQYWGYAPTLGRFESFYHQPWGNLKQAMPPAACMAVPVAVFVVADLRRRGSQGHAVGDVVRAAMRALPIALSMVIVTEPIFTIPGLGHLLYMSTVSKDFLLLRSVASLFVVLPLAVWLFLPQAVHVLPERRPAGGWRNSTRAVVWLGLALVVVFVVVGVLGPWLAPHNPYRLVGQPNEAWSWSHPLGTDRVGRDELSRVLYAMRSSVRLSAAVLAFGFLPGSLAALALGRLGKRISRVAADVADRSSAVPWVVVLLLAIRAYGFGLRPLAVCLSAYAFLSAVALAPSVADTTRGSYKTLWSRLRPAVAGRIGSAVAAAILGEATISFLGLAPGTRVSLGRDLSDARTSFPYNNWIEAAAGGALLLMLLGFNILRFAMDSESHPSGESLE